MISTRDKIEEGDYMRNFFKNALKVSIASLVISIILYVVIIGFFLLSAVTAGLIQITVSILILSTIVGFIYAFFIKGKQKFIFLSLNFVSICVISFGVYLSIALRDFAP